MSVVISGSNPAYSLTSVLDAQLKVLTELDQASSKPAASSTSPAAGTPTFNNLPAQAPSPKAAPLPATGDGTGATSNAPAAPTQPVSVQATFSQVSSLANQASSGSLPTDTGAGQAQPAGVLEPISVPAATTPSSAPPQSVADTTASAQQQPIPVAVLTQANADAGHLNAYLSQYA